MMSKENNMTEALKLIIETLLKEFAEKLYEHFKNESNNKKPEEPEL